MGSQTGPFALGTRTVADSPVRRATGCTGHPAVAVEKRNRDRVESEDGTGQNRADQLRRASWRMTCPALKDISPVAFLASSRLARNSKEEILESDGDFGVALLVVQLLGFFK